MTRVEFLPEVYDDFDRFLDHMARFEVVNPSERIAEIVCAIQVLTHSPFLGRPDKAGKRELVIGRGAHGYVALYRYVVSVDVVFVLAVRHQREDGFQRGDRS